MFLVARIFTIPVLLAFLCVYCDIVWRKKMKHLAPAIRAITYSLTAFSIGAALTTPILGRFGNEFAMGWIALTTKGPLPGSPDFGACPKVASKEVSDSIGDG